MKLSKVNFKNTKPQKIQELIRTRGSKFFIRRNIIGYTGCQIFVVFVSNTLVYEMGGVSYLLNFRFWPGVKRPHETKQSEFQKHKAPKNSGANSDERF